MLSEKVRRELGGGPDTSLVAGFGHIRNVLDARHVDTFVIFDTHWFTTTEHAVAGADHHSGSYTSEELPRVIHGLAYDYPGAPALAQLVHEVAKERGIRMTNVISSDLPHHYPTLNVLRYLHHRERVLSTAICQTAEPDDFLAFGAAIGEAVRRSDVRVAMFASGGMSHRFWPLRLIPTHQGYSPENVITTEARKMDEQILALWEEGDHCSVLELYPAYRQHSPEGHFGHYLTMLGALGGPSCRARGVRCSDYENSIGTGQVHVMFDIAPSSQEPSSQEGDR